ncbi:hypothetical protein [Bradyrhizobium sp.]|uniref:hypothetical protein n=1 Tax=Bradyrhizobium sp. TaxID=376 RepID=UPI001EBCB01C|nr:hypothetical protein [Bradyrhizobium sp.]MBV8916803.1 hypothetical protein [Bradyrhizobium sp.]MBV9984543.1 hypothetical protein [Bradyrhizobium sp.]
MRGSVRAALVCALSLLSSVPVTAQTPNPAMNAPDQLAWQFFIQVNTSAGGSNALFETWASDTDTFNPAPQFPTTAAPLALHPPVVPGQGRLALQRGGRLLPAVPPGPGVLEESRRNKESFDFIVQNNLFRISGLRAAFGKTLSFPVAAMEVKANWQLVTDIPAFTNGRVALADVPKLYHVNTGADGKQYAFVSMHIISKAVPNWTWATFEHKFNPGRCDIIGCKDLFGALTSVVQPNRTPNQGYPDCAKTPALQAMISAANWDPAFANYCLKGSQTDFTDASGLDIRVGNSVTENGFVDQSSCMTCHGRAAFDRSGNATSQAGFDDNGAPLGPIQANWYWNFNSQPPIFEGMSGLTQIGTSADFVWSIPFCAIDDTQNPIPPSNCSGK